MGKSPAPYQKKGKEFKGINKSKLEKLCRWSSSGQQILRGMGVSENQIEEFLNKEYGLEHLGQLMELEKADMCNKIFERCMEVAMDGDVSMLKFLARNLMGFSERESPNVALTQNNTSNIQFNIVPASADIEQLRNKLDEIDVIDDDDE